MVIRGHCFCDADRGRLVQRAMIAWSLSGLSLLAGAEERYYAMPEEAPIAA